MDSAGFRRTAQEETHAEILAATRGGAPAAAYITYGRTAYQPYRFAMPVRTSTLPRALAVMQAHEAADEAGDRLCE